MNWFHILVPYIISCILLDNLEEWMIIHLKIVILKRVNYNKIVVLHINLRQLELFRYSNSKSLQSLSICQIIFRHRPRDWEKSNFTQNYSIERKQNASTKSQSINHSVETSEATRFSEWWDILQGNRKHL